MAQIMDAPYIREAERVGYPSTEFNPYPSTDRMSIAYGYMSHAVSELCRAADLADGTEYARQLDELIAKLEDIQGDVGLLKEKMMKEG